MKLILSMVWNVNLHPVLQFVTVIRNVPYYPSISFFKALHGRLWLGFGAGTIPENPMINACF
jgi:hypothetical protein